MSTIKDMRSLLTDPAKGTTATKLSPMSKLIRGYLYSNNYTNELWMSKLNTYLNTADNGSLTTIKKSTDRNNLNQVLARKDVTWKSFKRFLQIVSCERPTLKYEFVWTKDVDYPAPPMLKHTRKMHFTNDDLRDVFKLVAKSVISQNLKIWLVLVEKFISAAYDINMPMYKTVTSNARGNIKKLIDTKSATHLSYESFCKLLCILGCTSFKIEILVLNKGVIDTLTLESKLKAKDYIEK
jgi:hypothetical protein